VLELLGLLQLAGHTQLMRLTSVAALLGLPTACVRPLDRGVQKGFAGTGERASAQDMGRP